MINPIYRDYYPFQHHYLERNGLRLHYLDEGQGEPIVMVHGNPTWSFYYRHVAQAARNHYRIIVPDHIGCGLSDKPKDSAYRYTLKSRIDDLEALLDQLGLHQNVTLLVHDWGGVIGMGVAARRPARIARIALLNTWAWALPPTFKLPLPLRFVRNTDAGALAVLGLNAFAFGATFVTRQPMPPRLRRAFVAPYHNWQARLATLRFVQDIPLAPSDPAFALLSDIGATIAAGAFDHLPRAIFWGERDFVFTTGLLDEWLRHWPDAEVHRYPHGGHFVLEDYPEDITTRFLDFLARHPLPQPTTAGGNPV